MAEAIAIILSLITIILLSVFLIRFKKIFSTDKVIEKTRIYMEKMIKDINAQSNRDLDLVRESSNRLKALLNETEYKMEQFREAAGLLQNAIAEAEKINRLSGSAPLIKENKNLEGIKPIRKPSSRRASLQQEERQTSLIEPDSRFEVSKPRQNSLFDTDEEIEKSNAALTSLLNDETTVLPDGAAYKHVPLIISRVLDEEPSRVSEDSSRPKAGTDDNLKIIKTNKTDFSEQVRDLFSKGMNVEQIAEELSCSITEVQFVIDMDL